MFCLSLGGRAGKHFGAVGQGHVPRIGEVRAVFSKGAGHDQHIAGFDEFFVQPFLSKIAGGPSSISQFATLPSAPFTSINRRACGLIQSSLVNEPVRLMGLAESNSAAKEWCAKTGAAAATIRMARTILRI